MAYKKRTLNNVYGVEDTNIRSVGNPDQWKLICKTWNNREGWMRSTKALDIPGFGCLVQISHIQQRTDYCDFSIVENTVALPNVSIAEIHKDETKSEVIGYKLIADYEKKLQNAINNGKINESESKSENDLNRKKNRKR